MKYFIFVLIAIGIFSSCASEKNFPSVEDHTITLSGIDEKQWTYISLSTGRIVGTSLLNSTEEDAQWRLRTDWDLAICGKYMRTNSGTSGIGKGGIQSMNGVLYDELATAPLGEYVIDSHK